VGTGNGKEISAIGLSGVLIADISTPNAVKDLIIGTGDGTGTTFSVPNSGVQDLVIKIDGSITTDYSIHPIAGYKPIQVPFRNRRIRGVTSNPTAIYELPNKLYNGSKVFILPVIIFDTYYLMLFSYIDHQLIEHYWFRGSKDYRIRATSTGEYIETASTSSSVLLKVNDDLTLTEVESISGSLIVPVVSDLLSIQNEKICEVEPESKYEIVLNTPPPQSATLTADFNIPYFLKDENHVLDYEITIKFGEGV